ncbi:MAG: hypothetical protein D6699_00015 [Aquificota bacterium]|nr:MAG: hypothetical protein D6699_00015 [Aquificota bacterium]
MTFKSKGGRAGFIVFAPGAGVRRRAPFRSQKVSMRADIIGTTGNSLLVCGGLPCGYQKSKALLNIKDLTKT